MERDLEEGEKKTERLLYLLCLLHYHLLQLHSPDGGLQGGSRGSGPAAGRARS